MVQGSIVLCVQRRGPPHSGLGPELLRRTDGHRPSVPLLPSPLPFASVLVPRPGGHRPPGPSRPPTRSTPPPA
eukprot:2161014-Rhodomonas_salina.1